MGERSVTGLLTERLRAVPRHTVPVLLGSIVVALVDLQPALGGQTAEHHGLSSGHRQLIEQIVDGGRHSVDSELPCHCSGL